MSDVDDLMTWLQQQLENQRHTADALKALAHALPTETRAYLTEVANMLSADVNAKRRILELYDVSTSRELNPDAWELMKHAVRALALPYADRPGYRDEWAPTSASA